MRGRVGVVVMVLSLFGAGLAAGGIHAGLPLSATTTTTATTATATATTSTVTTAATTTVAATTAPPPKPKPRSAGKLLVATPVATPRCLVLAGFALLRPGRPPLALGPVAAVR